jgi:hypothetical protein
MKAVRVAEDMGYNESNFLSKRERVNGCETPRNATGVTEETK